MRLFARLARRQPIAPAMLLLAILLCAAPVQAQNAPTDTDPLARYLYPMARPLPSPAVRIVVSDAPQTRAWAEHARQLVTDWFPLICRFLSTQDFRPPRTVTLVFKKDLQVPAYTAGSTITINGKWVTEHPDDFGMVIHELTHVIQAYPDKGDKPGWLVEGIADYIRFYRYEPDVPRPRINPQRATYHDAYRTTAAFLAWVMGRYDRTLVVRLDRALRTGTYSADMFQQVTGKSVDTLWAEFIQTLPPPVARR
ncbi:MAG TPA: basic secretory protein-like protein [Chthonomonadaceae bacterium]|nr:basic secretory protein-like protein [Chthonomonadaceae bacterium]